MPTAFPAALDNFLNPTPADDLDTPAVLHTDQHSNLNDAVEALEAKVGVTGSLVTTTLDYLVSHTASFYATENKDSGTISAGMACAVHTSGVGVTKASATNNTKPSVGLAIATTAATFSVNVQTEGLFTQADWLAVTGSSSLAAHALYFLDPVTAGKLTVTPPTTVGQVLQIVGVAVSTDTLDLSIEPPILL